MTASLSSTLTTNFSGLATGIDTKALVAAIMAQESLGLNKLTAKETENTNKSTIINSLKSGINTLNTSLAVLNDKLKTGDATAITAAMQSVVNNFNAVQKIYNDNSSITKGSDGSIVKGPLADDPTIKNLMSQMESDFRDSKNTATLAYSNPASIGIKTAADGTLNLDTATFQAALTNDPNAVKSIAGFTSLQTLLGSATASNPDSALMRVQNGITMQNRTLDAEISSTQARLAIRESMLNAQFSKMETVVAQMKASTGSLFNGA